MANDLQEEIAKLTAAGKNPSQVQIELEEQGFAADVIAEELSLHHAHSDNPHRRNSRILALRDVFDRVGYGAVTPQFVNILFWLCGQSWPYILFLVGLLNGLKTLLSVVWSNILQEYNKVHKCSKNCISTAGVIFGFSFLVMAFALLVRNYWLFAAAFLVGTIGIVAYGDLYQSFVHSVIKRERMSLFLQGMAHWGIIITAASLLLSGFLLDAFPLSGTQIAFELFGRTFSMRAYGFLFSFEIAALAFILSGYATSFIKDTREERKYPFLRFLSEYARTLRRSAGTFWSSKYVLLLTVAGIVTGLLQMLITAYSGIAIYKLFAAQYAAPFFALAIVYAIAIIASFTGPFFTDKIHKSTGLAPTMVFGTLLMAVLPLVLVFNANIAAITAAVCLNVVGGAITGFGQGMLARKLLSDEVRHTFFRAQSFVLVLPYVVAIPVLSWIANQFPLKYTFILVAAGLVAFVMPLYFALVVVSQRMRL